MEAQINMELWSTFPVVSPYWLLLEGPIWTQYNIYGTAA